MARTITDCPHTDRPHRTKGKCGSCYTTEMRARNPRMAECHPDRPHYAKGKCVSCYNGTYIRKRKAECHPNKGYHAFGLCKLCYQKSHRQKRRKELISTLGDRCECCGDMNYEFLAIDHIHGGGSKHVRDVGAYQVQKDVIANPEKYRILCHNCNFSLGAYGYCPHQKENNNE